MIAMATVSVPATDAKPEPLGPPELHSGDRMTRQEFHRIYERMPKHFKAELIGGIVYVTSPLRRRHGTRHLRLGTIFMLYEGQTPGVEAGDNTTVILSDEDEPQPDLYLRILPEYSGRSRTTDDDYVEGGPELLAEISHSTRSIDLHGKKDKYSKYGIVEYIVVCLRERQVLWMDLQTGEQFSADDRGVLRSKIFPGLWVDAPALLKGNIRQMTATLQQGLSTPEHAAFVAKLAAAQVAPPPS
jgi:Uma2 family endonuclease